MSSLLAGSALDTETRALLEKVNDDRDRRCAAQRSAAEGQAQQIVRSSRAEARASVHKAVIQERARMDQGLRQAAARADIEVRRQERQKSRELLAQMWAAIAESLERRWRDSAHRYEWIDAVLNQAGALLAGRAWLIEIDCDLTPAERDGLTGRARARGAATVEYATRAAMPAGLKVRAGSVCVDATLPGLLARREAIEAAFLAEYLPAPAAREERTDA
jgi:vacuolar-type H+-ATPase subunit E/Vma4